MYQTETHVSGLRNYSNHNSSFMIILTLIVGHKRIWVNTK